MLQDVRWMSENMVHGGRGCKELSLFTIFLASKFRLLLKLNHRTRPEAKIRNKPKINLTDLDDLKF